MLQKFLQVKKFIIARSDLQMVNLNTFLSEKQALIQKIKVVRLNDDESAFYVFLSEIN